jgi:4'-phosphopantetheinyl transferase
VTTVAPRFEFDDIDDVDVWTLEPSTPVLDALASVLAADPSELEVERRCGRCGGADHGKPHLVGAHRGAIEWSVARSRGVTLLAVSRRGVVGIDVERLRPVRDPVGKAARFRGPAATDAVADAPATERSAVFWRQWTRAEACVKADGVGVAGLQALAAAGHTSWVVHDLAAPSGYVAALAVRP